MRLNAPALSLIASALLLAACKPTTPADAPAPCTVAGPAATTPAQAPAATKLSERRNLTTGPL